MKEQVTETEKKELDRVRDSRRDQQPYASELDDREIERAHENVESSDATDPKGK